MTGRAITIAGCDDCLRGLDHCHTTLVLHVDEWGECPDPACDARLDRHTLLVLCTDLDPHCTCGGSRGT